MRDPGRERPGAADPVSAFVERHEAPIVCAAALVGLVVRLLHFTEMEANDPFFYHPSVDPRVYHEWAARIAAGDVVGAGVFFLSPLYPYALAALYAIAGPSLFAARLCGLVAGAGTAVLVYLLGKRTLGAATGALAALVWSVYPMAIFYDGDLLVTSVQTPLNLLLALACVRAAGAPGLRGPALAGLLLGLSALARPNVLLLAVPVVPWLAASRWRAGGRRALLPALAFAAAAGLAVSPATLRNAIVGGDAVLVSSQGGANFYIGNGRGATGLFRVPQEFPPTRADDPVQQEEAFRRFAEAEEGRALPPSGVSAYWWRRAWSDVADDPVGWARLLGRKAALFFNEFEPGNSGDFETARRYSRVLRLPLPSFAIVSPLALLGLGLAWRRRREAFVPYAFVAVYAASLTSFFVLSHYRMPVVPFLVLFAAHAVVRLAELARERRLVPLGLAVACGAAAVAFTRVDIVDERSATFIHRYNLGNKLRVLGRDAEALAEYEGSIAENPDYVSAHVNLGLLAERDPALRERAVAAWRRVLELGLESRDAEYVEKARRHLRRLEGTRPGAGGGGGALADGGCEGCNVLLVTIETLRADRLGCLGYAADPAPEVCAFGRSGLLFENAYTPAPITIPAMQAIMSGTLPSNEDLLELIAQTEHTETIAAGLGRRGYRTAALTDHRGFGELDRLDPQSLGVVKGFAELRNFGVDRRGKTSARVIEAAKGWLGEHRAERFFLWLHLFDTHFNWTPSPESAAAFGYREGACGRVPNGVDIDDLRKIEGELTPAERSCLEALYLGEVLETDRLVGDLLRRVDGLGLSGKTIVIIAGDHGEELGDRGYVGHGRTVYDELTHVPLMVRNPAARAKGRRKEPISTLAIHDYVLAATAGRPAEGLPPVVSRTFHYNTERNAAPGTAPKQLNRYSLVRGSLKYILEPATGKAELYDLAADPLERADLRDRHPAAGAMGAELGRWIEDNRSVRDPATSGAMQEYREAILRLKALGYTR